MKTLIWLPSILAGYLMLLTPRWLFALTYTPASPARREAENEARNAGRYAAYKAKKLVYGDNA